MFFVLKSDHLVKNYNFTDFSSFWPKAKFKFFFKKNHLKKVQKIFQVQLFSSKFLQKFVLDNNYYLKSSRAQIAIHFFVNSGTQKP